MDKSALLSVDFSEVKGLKEPQIFILNKIREALINNEALYEQRWMNNFLQQNYATEKPYKGVNALVLAIKSYERGQGNIWLTFKQMQDLNKGKPKEEQISLNKGAKGEKICRYGVYDKILKREINEKDVKEMGAEEYNKRRLEGNVYSFTKEFYVFNSDDFKNLPIKENLIESPQKNDIDFTLVKDIAKVMGVNLQIQPSQRAFYTPMIDTVVLPTESQWKNNDLAKATAFHELSHATGHPTRLNRDLSGDKYTLKYAREELVAEFSSAFLSSKFLMDNTIKGSARYVDNWSQILVNHPKEILKAIGDASRASNFIEKAFEKVLETSINKEDYWIIANNEINTDIGIRDYSGEKITRELFEEIKSLDDTAYIFNKRCTVNCEHTVDGEKVGFGFFTVGAGYSQNEAMFEVFEKNILENEKKESNKFVFENEKIYGIILDGRTEVFVEDFTKQGLSNIMATGEKLWDSGEIAKYAIIGIDKEGNCTMRRPDKFNFNESTIRAMEKDFFSPDNFINDSKNVEDYKKDRLALYAKNITNYKYKINDNTKDKEKIKAIVPDNSIKEKKKEEIER